MKNKQAELVSRLTDRELHLQLLLTQGILAAAVVILSLIFGIDAAAFLRRLADTGPLDFAAGAAAGMAAVCMDLLFMKVVPPKWYDDGGVNERIFSSLSAAGVIGVSLLVAVCEEFLFRGVLQVHFGLFWASVIFALVHYRYLFNWFLFLNIMTVSFFIGLLFWYTGSLSACILMHFLIDCILGLRIYKQRHPG